jgi:hypothetical protein
MSKGTIKGALSSLLALFLLGLAITLACDKLGEATLKPATNCVKTRFADFGPDP